MLEEIATMMDRIGAHGIVYNGGSTSIHQAGPYSDREYYVITESLKDLLRVLKHKQELSITNVDLLLATKWMVNHRFFYILGTDHTGALVPCDYDPRLLRNRGIKLGYRAYLDSTIESDPLRKQYLLSKAAIQLVYAYALGLGERVPRPLFSPDGAIALVHMIDALPSTLADTVRLKFIPTIVDTEEFEQDLRTCIDMTMAVYLKHPVSIRSYLWRSAFALKKKQFGNLFCNIDKRQIRALYDMIQTSMTDRYNTLRTELIDILVV